jgi:hypothetical protein
LKRILCCFAVALLFASCASTLSYEPKSDTDALLAGVMEMHLQNFEYMRGISLNGTAKTGIMLNIKTLESGAVTRVGTDESGLFYLGGADPACTYYIDSIDFTKTENGVEMKIKIACGRGMLTVKPVAGKVNNLGLLKMTADGGTRQVRLEREEVDPRSLFAAKWKDSMWNGFDFLYLK